jgi:hypothetical protein
MLVLTGERASGDFLIAQAKLVAEDVEGVVAKGAGHWLIDEAPGQVIPKLGSVSRSWSIFDDHHFGTWMPQGRHPPHSVEFRNPGRCGP